MTWSEADRRRNTEQCVRSTIETQHDHYGLRPHEIDRAVKLGADLAEKDRSLNWGQIANAVSTTITSGGG
jgi:hypothetical protein